MSTSLVSSSKDAFFGEIRDLKPEYAALERDIRAELQDWGSMLQPQTIRRVADACDLTEELARNRSPLYVRSRQELQSAYGDAVTEATPVAFKLRYQTCYLRYEGQYNSNNLPACG